MGGLVLRYYLRYGAQPLPEDGSIPRLTWAGAANVANAILVATPLLLLGVGLYLTFRTNFGV